MQAPIISIIIPIYNTEKYLPKCLDSILAQTYTNWEAILVDDGSTDNSGKICDEYANKDSRFNTIHQINGGVSSARLNGFKLSKGEYVFFLDSDDTLPEKTLEILYSKTNGNQLLICGSMTLVYPDNRIQKLYDMNRTIDSSEIIESILLFKREYSWELPSKLFHRSILDVDTLTISKDIKVFEDYIITLRVLNKIKTVEYTSENTYNYIIRDGSATQTNKFNLKKIEEISKEIEFICNNELYGELLTRCKIQMLGWIIEDDLLTKKCDWFKTLSDECCNIKLGKIEKLNVLLVKVFKRGKIRKKIYNFLLNIK